MLTFSEIILTGTVWSLTGAGLFFGLRANWRRRKTAADPTAPAPGRKDTSPDNHH